MAYLLSKKPTLFAPEIWPPYYSKAKGSKIWDLDERELLDMSSMCVGSCILGYSDEDIDNSVIKVIKAGVNSSLNCAEEVELAKLFLDIHPWFHMVRYARGGGEAMSIAVRIARAYTGKDIVLFSGYHGWADWYLSANLSNCKALDGHVIPGLLPNGVPRALTKTAIPFPPNSISHVIDLFDKYKGKISAVVIEPARSKLPPPDYLLELRKICTKFGAVLIFDEITSGFRTCLGGVHSKLEVKPDMAVFAKAVSNGYAMSLIAGIHKVMKATQQSFVSSTNWTDRIGPTAALATIQKFKKLNVHKHIIHVGNLVKKIWIEEALKNDLDINVNGLDSLPSFEFNYQTNYKLITLYTVEMLKLGILSYNQFKPSLAHNAEDLQRYHDAVKKVFKVLGRDKSGSSISDDKVKHTSFRRLTS